MDDGRIPKTILKRAKRKVIPTKGVKVSLMANDVRNETGHDWSGEENDASSMFNSY